MTETWANCQHINFVNEYHIDGYTLYQRDRTLRRGGGLMIYCSTDLVTEEINLDFHEHLEILAIKVKTGISFTHLVSVYRAPNQTAELDALFYSTLQGLVKSEFILVGDFNVPEFVPQLMNTNAVRQLNSFAEENFLCQSVDKPTRGNNVLDLVFSSRENLVYNLEVGDTLANSDHKTIVFNLNVKSVTTTNNKRIPDFRRAKFSKFREEMSRINWDNLLSNVSDLDSCWNLFKDKIKEIRARCVPNKFKRVVANNPGWFNETIKHAIIQRDRAYTNYTQNSNDINKDLFYRAKRRVKAVVKSSKRNYEKSLAENCKKKRSKALL